MSFLKQQELQLEPWRGLPARSAAEQFPNRREDSQRIAIEAWLGLDFLVSGFLPLLAQGHSV